MEEGSWPALSQAAGQEEMFGALNELFCDPPLTAPPGPASPACRPLGAEDKALLWRFRYALTHDSRALTKFLKCVDWSDASEARQAAELMQQWAPVGVADALELLSPDFANEEVRGRGRGGRTWKFSG